MSPKRIIQSSPCALVGFAAGTGSEAARQAAQARPEPSNLSALSASGVGRLIELVHAGDHVERALVRRLGRPSSGAAPSRRASRAARAALASSGRNAQESREARRSPRPTSVADQARPRRTRTSSPEGRGARGRRQGRARGRAARRQRTRSSSLSRAGRAPNASPRRAKLASTGDGLDLRRRSPTCVRSAVRWRGDRAPPRAWRIVAAGAPIVTLRIPTTAG
jgi:hypothetical protein